jgi:hypothetical protein
MRVYRIPSRDFLLVCGQYLFPVSGTVDLTNKQKRTFNVDNRLHFTPSSLSSLHVLGESPVPASSVVSLSIFFLVYLCLVFRMVNIYMPVVECGFVPFFADLLSIYSCILLFFRLKGKCPTFFSYPRFLSNLIQCIL